MIIVAGQLLVDPAERDGYLAGCAAASVAEYDVAAVRSLT